MFLLTEFIVIFSTSKEKKQEENYWVVGLNTSSLYCIACKYAEMFPQVYIITLDIKVFTYLENIGSPLFFLPFQVTPKPILTILDLSLPLASSDLGAASLENELILKQLRLYEVFLSPYYTILICCYFSFSGQVLLSSILCLQSS